MEILDAPPTYASALRWLGDVARVQHPRTREAPQLARIHKLLELAGNPQEQLRVIHLAGTSGKGSTATILSHVLRAVGARVGVSVSPHLLDVRERMQIDGMLASEEQFLEALRHIFPAIQQVASSPLGHPSYFEILTAMAYQLFSNEEVAYAIIETGMGGRFDSTNSVHRADKIAVLTRIGFDHIQLLGRTLTKIASEKVGIIQPMNAVFSVAQKPRVRACVASAAQQHESHLRWIEPKKNFRIHTLTQHGTYFDFIGSTHTFAELELNLIGAHQAENAAIALAVVEYLSARDRFDFDEQKIREALRAVPLHGRFERIRFHDHPLIFDVAHNPQKIKALLQTLQKLWPKQRFTFVLAFGPRANQREMLRLISPLAEHIVFPDFVVTTGPYAYRFIFPDTLIPILSELGYQGSVSRVLSIEDALSERSKTQNIPVIYTGYFHFISALYAEVALSQNS